jgi:outer membrane protein OmpA-like peptidoglycan-associated protein
MYRNAAISCFFFFLFFGGALCTAAAETFEFKHATGNKYRILSVVEEDVYIDRRFSHRAKILNRVSVEISNTEGDAARHNAVFSSSEQILEGDSSFRWSEEYISVFWRNQLGHLSIEPEYYMPVVRNMPVFPGRDLHEGESWSAPGYEVHDFRKAFGIEQPYHIPFEANYTFLGYREWKGKAYPVFSAAYRIFYEPQAVSGRVWPRRIMGASDQIVFWDLEAGQAAAYDESFRMVFELSNGMIVEYRGRAEAERIESEIMNKENLVQDIIDEIEKLGIDDVSVRVGDEGITINLENIQFPPDSALLLDSEKIKLDKIGDILSQFAGRDILVGGHTALAGTAEGRMKLSTDRAAAVANYLISKGVRESSHVVVRGYGAERPLADNRTTLGAQRNRRVEITLLEN